MRSTLGIAMVVNLVFSSGCSLVFVKSPPEDARQIPPTEEMECTSGVAAPVIDSLIGGYQVFRTGYAVAGSDADYADAPISRGADIGLGVGLATLFVASAVYGFVTTSSCEDAKHRYHAARRPLPPRQTDPGATTLTFIVNPSSAPPPVTPPREAQAPAPEPTAPPAPEAPPAVAEPLAPEPSASHPTEPTPPPAPPLPPSAAFPETLH